ncbi:MAG: YidB family protein [Pseudomonadota bacterium]
MGLLDELLGGMADGAGGRAASRQAPANAGGMGGVVAALLPVVLAMLANRDGGARTGAGRGGLDDLLGQVLGAGRALASTSMGGLGALLEQFQRAGFGEQARSWVGTGQNQPISPEVIAQVFGPDGLSAIAARAGLSETEAAVGLSELLPDVVDRVTPRGEVPVFRDLTACVDDMARRLGL